MNSVIAQYENCLHHQEGKSTAQSRLISNRIRHFTGKLMNISQSKEITPASFQEALNLFRSQVSPRYANLNEHELKQFMNWLADNDYISENPATAFNVHPD